VRLSVIFWFFLALFGLALVFVFTPHYGGGGKARCWAAHADIHGGITSAINQYFKDNGSYPGIFQDLVQQPTTATHWQGPYFESTNLPVDPWGNLYIYEYPGKHGTYDLISAGPDGKPGTEDDIVNWTK